MEKILFVTNKIFVDETKPEGGVRYCTLEFIELLKVGFDVKIFHLSFNTSILHKIKSKLGIDVFDDYRLINYKSGLLEFIRKESIKYIFINLSSASAISRVVKEEFGDSVKVILCSHGIEGGDFLHHSVRFKSLLKPFHHLTSSFKLGKILQNELLFRINYFDLVLTVSEIEIAIEKWLGAKKVFFVPRIFSENFLPWHPIIGRLGFVGDVSHYPNYYGLLNLCEAIDSSGQSNIIIRVVGKKCRNLDILTNKYKFVESLGYLDNDKLEIESSSWMYYLNLVMYYSKGVSTKLSKGMNWGLPVLSTEAGNRGYIFNKGGVITVTNMDEILEILKSRSSNISLLEEDKKQVELAVKNSYTLRDVYNQLVLVLESI